jgi:repressor LexA
MALTRRQKEVLDVLIDFINRKGYSPSFEEIGESLGLSSLATVHKHIENLHKKGFIRRGINQSRSIDVVALPGPVPVGRVEVHSRKRSRRQLTNPAMAPRLPLSWPLEFPLLGRIAAGQPVETLANRETLSLGEFVHGKGNVYVLRVKGDSMIDDHICDGDYILVEGVQDAANGEIVVALIDGQESTLKRLFREANGRVRLQPANSQMDPIFVEAPRLQVQGKVIGVLRKY